MTLVILFCKLAVQHGSLHSTIYRKLCTVTLKLSVDFQTSSLLCDRVSAMQNWFCVTNIMCTVNYLRKTELKVKTRVQYMLFLRLVY